MQARTPEVDDVAGDDRYSDAGLRQHLLDDGAGQDRANELIGRAIHHARGLCQLAQCLDEEMRGLGTAPSDEAARRYMRAYRDALG